MLCLKVYEIYNKNDPNDKNNYIGSTIQKRLCTRWGHHRGDVKRGKLTKLHCYMREKGLENFACRLIHKQELKNKDMDVIHQIEQRFIDKLKPTLNTNNCHGFKDTPSDGKRTRVVENKNENDYQKKQREYNRNYHKKYQKEYYKKNKEKRCNNNKKLYQLNKERICKETNTKNALIRASGKYRCELCCKSFTSPSALKTHGKSKKHMNFVLEQN